MRIYLAPALLGLGWLLCLTAAGAQIPVPGAPKVVVEYFGDSTIQGGAAQGLRPPTLLQFYIDTNIGPGRYTVINMGQGALAAHDAVRKPQPKYGNETFPVYMERSPAHLVLVSFGINDVGRTDTDLWNFAADIRAMRDAAVSKGKAFASISPAPINHPLNEPLGAWLGVLREQAAFWGWPHVDAYEPIRLTFGEGWNIFLDSTGLHPMAQGSQFKEWIVFNGLRDAKVLP